VIPGIVTDIVRVEGSNTQTSIDIEWTPAYNGGAEITGYQVWWNAGGQGPVNEIAAVTESNSFKAEGLDPGAVYGFAVKAINDVGIGQISD